MSQVSPTQPPNDYADWLEARIDILMEIISETDDKIFEMSQHMSWEGMRPIYAELLRVSTARKRIRSDYIGREACARIIVDHEANNRKAITCQNTNPPQDKSPNPTPSSNSST